MKTTQELLSRSTGTEKTGQKLIETKIYDTLIKAVRKKLIGRRYIAITMGPEQCPGSSVDFDLQTADTMEIEKVAEGAEVPIDAEEYSTFNIKPVKYGIRITITNEMREDAKWDILRYNIETAGYKFAENEDDLFVDQLDAANTAAGHTVSGSGAITIDNITEAQKNIRDDKMDPDVFLFGSEIYKDLQNIDTFMEADKWGNRDTLETGFVNHFLNMDFVFSHSVTSTHAYAFDSRHAMILVEKRPLTMKEYDDPVRDMKGIVITQRIKYRYLRANAVSKITT
ncbi:MAG: phage major capsid protein [Candidatus Aenigmatarchaeota archaeon]